MPENGYINDDLGLKWLEHFDKHTKRRTVGNYRLLILDGHHNHYTYRFEQICYSSHITRSTKFKFLTAFKAASNKSIIESDIQGGFRGAVLVPHDPEEVIS